MTAAGADMSPFSARVLACLKAPDGGDDTGIVTEDGALLCPQTGQRWPLDHGVPTLFHAPDDGDRPVTEKVRSFYEEHPFPSYEGLEEFGELVNKGLTNSFSSRILEAIGYNKLVLECGCGTGQLTHFLQLNNNHVLGIDMSLASLRLAIEHKMRNLLDRAGFCQMNIFELAIRDASFDVVIAHGVLHHTADARRAFAAIARKVKPGGVIMVGLYNSTARIPTWLRSKLVGILGPRIDYVVRNRIRDARKAEIWIKDQYYNPHETWHSVGEVLDWFDQNDIEFLNCWPPVLGSSTETAQSLFDRCDPGTAYQRAVTQISWLATIAREGALFDVIGRRRA